MEIILNQVLILSILAGVGAMAYRLRILTDVGRQAIAALLVNITLPLLIVTSISKITLTMNVIENSMIILLFSYCSIGMLYISGRVSARFQKLTRYRADVHTLCTMFGNIVFIGYPVFNALYPGGEGILYAALYHLASDTVLWTYGIVTLNQEENAPDSKFNLKRIFTRQLLNPNLIAFALAIVLVLVKFKFPYILDVTFSGLGGTTLYLAMLYIGSMLAKNKLVNKTLLKESLILTINKMLFIPFLFLLFINASEQIINIQISLEVKTVLVVQTAMPCLTVIAILARENTAAQVGSYIFVSTIFCLASLPFMLYVIKCLA